MKYRISFLYPNQDKALVAINGPAHWTERVPMIPTIRFTIERLRSSLRSCDYWPLSAYGSFVSKSVEQSPPCEAGFVVASRYASYRHNNEVNQVLNSIKIIKNVNDLIVFIVLFSHYSFRSHGPSSGFKINKWNALLLNCRVKWTHFFCSEKCCILGPDSVRDIFLLKCILALHFNNFCFIFGYESNDNVFFIYLKATWRFHRNM
jgi:hypothetical protein